MAYIVTKKNGLRYWQESYREGGKVKTRHLGPVGGKPRKQKLRGGFALPFSAPFVLLVHALRKSFDKTYDRARSKSAKGRVGKVDPRSQERQDAYDRARWHETRMKEIHAFNIKRDVYVAQHAADIRERFYHLGRPSPVAAAKDRYAQARQEAQKEVTAPPTPTAKNFTVDDAIEAREARTEAAVAEHNAGTQAAPDSPAPADAPSPAP